MIHKEISKSELYKEISNNIKDIKIFDAHEHLMLEKERKTKKIDFFLFFSHYASSDLISSGLGKENFGILKDINADTDEKWKYFVPYWENIKNTTYSEAIKIILKDIYDIDSVSLAGVNAVSDKMKKFKEINFYDHILKKMSNIDFILNDIDQEVENHGITMTEPDREDFLPVIRFDLIFEINSIIKIRAIEKKFNTNIYNFKDLVKIIDNIFEKRKDKTYAFKIGSAYSRNMGIEDFSYFDADINFEKLLKLNEYNDYSDSLPIREIKIFQDHLYNYCIKKCIEINIPIQIHTGLLEGNNSDIRNSNPLLHIDLIKKYKKARFDLFHIGYPYTEELITIVKMFPNCYINMCWIAEVSRVLYKNTLRLLIDMIPSNKIIGFGGDYAFIEGAYAAQKMARENIAKVLSEKVLENYFTFEEAIEFAEKILYKNAKMLYLE